MNFPPALSVISTGQGRQAPKQVCFDKAEFQAIFDVYARMVTYGEWRDYSLDMHSALVSFNIYRRASEMPIYAVVKEPALARKQGAFRLTAANGQILKRGHSIGQVLAPLKAQLIKVVESQQ